MNIGQNHTRRSGPQFSMMYERHKVCSCRPSQTDVHIVYLKRIRLAFINLKRIRIYFTDPVSYLLGLHYTCIRHIRRFALKGMSHKLDPDEQLPKGSDLKTGYKLGCLLNSYPLGDILIKGFAAKDV